MALATEMSQHIETSPKAWPSATTAWGIVLVLSAANLISYLDRTVLSLLVGPIKKSLSISDTQIGLLQGTAFGLFYSALILPLGYFADRTNRSRLLATGVAFWSIMTSTCGLATNFSMFFLTRMGVGIGEATLSPTAPSIISDLFPAERRAPPMSVFIMGSSLGGGLALLLGGVITETVTAFPTMTLPLLGKLESWQVVCMVVGIPGILVSLLLLLIGEPRRRGYSALESRPRELWIFIKKARRVLLPHFAGFSLLYTYAVAQGAWTPSLFVRAHDWTIGQVGFRYGLAFLIFGTSGALSGGIVARALRRGGRTAACLFTVGLAMLVVSIPATIAPLVGNAYASLALFCPVMFLLASMAGPSAAAVQEITPNAMRGQITALYYFAISLIGITTGPVLVGLLNDKVFGEAGTGLSLATLAAGLCLPAGLLLMAAARERGRCVITLPEYP